ncbi:MAG: hypothetical protein JO142_02305 [Burkholderiales bacterium]|nr:hypothetical protein [Burkholderiales bacterium]
MSTPQIFDFTIPGQPTPWRYITKTAFIKRFTSAEAAAMQTANANSTALAQGWLEFNDATYVWLDDPGVSLLLNGYVAAGALVAARVPAVLTPPAAPAQNGAPGEGYYGPL